ncbi:MAG: N-hydroxyarylamine O-acetyltransferase [Acidimicrobiaceae bacterium]
MDAELQAAYLGRLGLEAEPPSVDALQQLHRRQVERVPYETMWIHMGEAWTIDLDDAIRRIARHGRGGYCFHLNGAFSELLRSLGYAVTRHVGGVHGPGGPSEDEMSNHLVLTVSGLPRDDNPSGTWYVDAGLGHALHQALPLAAGDYEQGPFRFRLEETPGDVGDWHFTNDPTGSFEGMSWRADSVGMDQFADRHEWLSTSPDSGFVRVATAQRRDESGVDIIRGLVLTRVGGNAETSELTDRHDWFEALADLFDLRFDGAPSDSLDRLWAKSVDGHRAWDAAGRP